MRRSSKQVNIQQINLTLTAGLNYSQSPANVGDNELTRAYNMIYDPSTDRLVSRPGTQCKTATASSNSILRGYYYKKDAINAWHVMASGGKLYYLGGAGTDTWVEIGDLNDATTVPSFVTFNSKLLIADGGSDIKYWDGTTYGTIASSPDANALTVIKNRVVANSVSEPDSVYLSKANDETDWNTSGSAVGLKAGYGDLMSVNGFVTFQDDLIISKQTTNAKAFYRLNVADTTTTNWYVIKMSDKNCAQNNRSIIQAWNNVFFLDSNGFKSIKGVQQYGDLQIDTIGRKINSLFSVSSVYNGIYSVPSYNAIWFCLTDNVVAYTERYSAELGMTVPAMTLMYFNQGRITSIYEVDNVVYLTGFNGHLYYLDETSYSDETAIGTTSYFISRARTKLFTFPNDIILRRAQFFISPKAEGTGNVYVAINDTEKYLLGTFTTVGESEYVYDATEYIDDATDTLFDTGNEAWIEDVRARWRGKAIGFELECPQGRFGLDWVRAEIAPVDGGD